MAVRRFPPPWSVEELDDACFIVKDSAGQQLAYIYFEDEPGRRGEAKFGCVARGDPPRGFLSVAGRLVVV
jgi:hypothetical protein